MTQPTISYTAQASLQTRGLPHEVTDLRAVAANAANGRMVTPEAMIDGHTGPLREQAHGSPTILVRYVQTGTGIHVVELLATAVPRRPATDALAVDLAPDDVDHEMVLHLKRLFDAWRLVGGPMPPELVAYFPAVLNSLEFWLTHPVVIEKDTVSPTRVPPGGRVHPGQGKDPAVPEADPRRALFTTPLESCFPLALTRKFESAGWHTLGDLYTLRLDDLLDVSGINPPMVARITKRLEELGLHAPGLMIDPNASPETAVPAAIPGSNVGIASGKARAPQLQISTDTSEPTDETPAADETPESAGGPADPEEPAADAAKPTDEEKPGDGDGRAETEASTDKKPERSGVAAEAQERS